MKHHGFTLTELMFTVVLIGVLAMVVMPQYGRAVERRTREAAIDVLRAIHSGEQTFWTHANTYRDANTLAEFEQVYAAIPAIGVGFSVTANGKQDLGAGYQATATRSAGPCLGKKIIINETWNGRSDPLTLGLTTSDPWPVDANC